jgi:hypothetical protein
LQTTNSLHFVVYKQQFFDLLLSPDNNLNKPYTSRSKYEFCKSGIEFQICKENEPNQLKNQRNTQFFRHFAVIGSDEETTFLSHAKEAH